MASEEDKAKNEAAIAAPGTLVLGGQTFICKPPSATDFAAWRKELRKQIQTTMRDPMYMVNKRISDAEKLQAPLSPTLVKIMVQEAMAADATGGKCEPTDGQIAEQTQTVEGIRYWAWLILKKAKPGLEKEWVDAQLPTEEEAYGMANQIAELAVLAKLSPK